jgi:2-dehydro-3-deoxyphosphogalactonate aldolase
MFLLARASFLKKYEVTVVRDAGGQLIISPNMSPEVIRETKATGMVSTPDDFAPTGAFQAIENGADGLKRFIATY